MFPENDSSAYMIDDHVEAWDKDYRIRGSLFGGSPCSLPNLPPGSRVLELGCGNGKTLRAMAINGWDIAAVDYSLQAILMCRERCSSFMIHLARADARTLPFRDNAFDTSFATHVAGHLLAGERVALAKEITRVTKPGGTLYFRDFGTADFRCGEGVLVEHQTFRRASGSITHYFSADEIGSLFSGFRSCSILPERWSLRVRGRDYQREEIVGEFEKTKVTSGCKDSPTAGSF
jgi:MPBQ/MSBQ methyltransferase